MKSKKWLWVTLTILLTLVVLTGVAGVSFRMGVMQSARFATTNAGQIQGQFPPFGHMRGYEGNFHGQAGDNPHLMQRFNHGSFGRDGFEHRRGGSWLSPIFGLFHVLILALILWGAYKLYQNSGWKFMKVPEAEIAPIEEKPAAKKKK
ncbi:MAG: hypothetical protein K8S20_17425 [Chloroflexi bacterium]|nr:hypothetical protein [Chloroflexota bacterium]